MSTEVGKPPRDWIAPLLRGWGVIVFLFLFAPIFIIVIYSFNTGRLLVSWNGFGFTGYEAVWQDEAIRNALWMSLSGGCAVRGICDGHRDACRSSSSSSTGQVDLRLLGVARPGPCHPRNR